MGLGRFNRYEVYPLDCCRCDRRMGLEGVQLDSYEKASRVVLCANCENDDHASSSNLEEA